MEHVPGIGKITVTTITGDQPKWDSSNPDPDFRYRGAEGTFVDEWLAQHPASEEEAVEGLTSDRLKVASGAGYTRGFEKEAAEISRYGSMEEFYASFEHCDFFADMPEIPFKYQFLVEMHRRGRLRNYELNEEIKEASSKRQITPAVEPKKAPVINLAADFDF
jgi:hypothetical protein